MIFNIKSRFTSRAKLNNKLIKNINRESRFKSIISKIQKLRKKIRKSISKSRLNLMISNEYSNYYRLNNRTRRLLQHQSFIYNFNK